MATTTKRKMALKKEMLKMKMRIMKIKILKKLGKAGMWLLAMSLVVAVAGCSTPASRAQSQTFDNCTIVVNIGAGTNVIAGAEQPQYGDILAQNMVVENSGTENTDQTHTVAPNVPISVPVGLGGGESLGVLGTLVERIFGSKAAASVADAACVGDDCSAQ